MLWRFDMKKRNISVAVLILITFFVLSGCAKKTELKNNIVDDNYRNYYEIFVYSFYDSDGDGIGDIKGVTDKLDYISDMGFNGIWLMPIMPSTTYHKYDVIDYKDIDPEYGTLEDMKELVRLSHEKGINIIIDFVMNHSSSKHPWFIAACDYLSKLETDKEPDLTECQYVGYYHFSKEKVNGNYYQVPNSEWFYEGSFWSEMPDLNYESEALKKEFEDIADFWVKDIGIDGFRMDAVMHFEENDVNFNTETMNWIYEYCKEINPKFYMVSEVWASESNIAKYYGSSTDSCFNFDAGDAEGKIVKAASGKLSAEKFVQSLAKYEEDFGNVYEQYIDAPFITNHDMGRVANALKSEPEALKYAGGLLLSMDGSPFVYYGEEIGMKSKGTKDENKRLPMLWSYDAESKSIGNLIGITKGPKDADTGIFSSFDGVYEQEKDPDSILNYYKKAISIRNAYPEIARGKIVIDEENTKDNIAVIKKVWQGKEIVIIYNNSPSDSYNFMIKGTPYEKYKLVAYLTEDGEEVKKGKTMLLPKRSIVYLKNE